MKLTHNNFKEAKEEIVKKRNKALYSIGEFVEGGAKVRAPVGIYTDGRVGGNLRSSYTYTVDEPAGKVTIGSPVEYAPYQELGTYKMAPQPHLKPAVTEEKDRIRALVKGAYK